MIPDKEYLIKLIRTRMPYGRYKGRFLVDLPEPYIVWMAGKGFKKDALGRMLQSVYEIKLNGLEALIEPIVREIRRT